LTHPLPILVDVICSLRHRPRNHCQACRTSARFRASLAKTFVMPEGGIEKCPFNVYARAPIPRDFDSEEEKRRLKGGGCCGPPHIKT
jgi:hypothetical protein